MPKIFVYITSVTPSTDTKKNQQRIEMVLTGKKIDAEYIDLASVPNAKDDMRRLMKDDKALPPQFFKGETYLGDYNAFDTACENEELEQFLQL